jgi:phosphocarrier protein FPr
MSTTYTGLPASPGIGIGALTIFRPEEVVPEKLATSEFHDPQREWRFFLDAHARVDTELEKLGNNENTLIAEIFAAHRVILQDKTLLESVHSAIYQDGNNAIAATHQVISGFIDLFRSFEDEYFAGRSVDIRDLGHRLLSHLGASLIYPELANLPPQTILVAPDLTSSEITQLPAGHVHGIVLAESTPTAHSAILARSLSIPMVCATGHAILHGIAGRMAIVDGANGQLLVDPTLEELARYRAARQDLIAQWKAAVSHVHEPAITSDGIHIPVCANANSPEEVAQSAQTGADGIGLLRTEYLFQGRATPPTFEEQRQVYAQFARQVTGQLTVRALDAGGDKPVEYIAHHREDNPFLGLRGVRLLIEQPEILRTQYRALQAAAQMAGYEVEIRFMLPMISTTEEVQTVRKLLDNLSAELPPLPIGIMIEVPSAALIASSLAPLVDFFSIGTNDLAQYVLASDRTNTTVARMVDPLHPAVLHLIKNTCQAGRMAGKPVSLCGEIAGDPKAAPLLLGLGVTELSAPLPAIPLIKQTVRRWDMARCRQLARHALRCHSAQAVHELLAKRQEM